jgi:guanylate kinase
MMRGNLIIISSPSGGGKGTLIREVRRRMPELGLSVSYTTRQMRDGEEDGREYFFVDRTSFETLVAQGEFLEYATVHGNYYGTSVSQVKKTMESGQDVILEIDVQGAGIVFGKMPSAVGIFILPPSYSVLADRLTSRGTENTEEIGVRLGNAHAEVKRFKDFTYAVVNDDLETAITEIETIIRAERLRTDRQGDVIGAILDSFGASRP